MLECLNTQKLLELFFLIKKAQKLQKKTKKENTFLVIGRRQSWLTPWGEYPKKLNYIVLKQWEGEFWVDDVWLYSIMLYYINSYLV